MPLYRVNRRPLVQFSSAIWRKNLFWKIHAIWRTRIDIGLWWKRFWAANWNSIDLTCEKFNIQNECNVSKSFNFIHAIQFDIYWYDSLVKDIWRIKFIQQSKHSFYVENENQVSFDQRSHALLLPLVSWSLEKRDYQIYIKWNLTHYL